MKYYTICNQLELIDNEILLKSDIDFMIKTLNENPMSIKYNNINKFISLDTETEGEFNFVNKLLSIQVGNENSLFFIAFQYLTENDKIKLINWFNNSSFIFIAHNAKFDVKFLRINKINITNIYCTLVIEKICYGGIQQESGFYSLANLCLRYFNVHLDKTVRGQITTSSINNSKVIFYALDDIKYLFKILELQLAYLYNINEYPQFDERDITNIYRIVGLENATVKTLAECELVGSKLDLINLEATKKIVDGEFSSILSNIKTEVFNCDILNNLLITSTLFGRDYKLMPNKKMFSWTSSTQKLWALKSVIPELQSTKSDVLYEYQSRHPIIPLLIQYNKIFKLKSSFIDVLPLKVNKVTGRIHTNFNQVLNTGRISCNEPNLMQIPSKGDLGSALRKCFVETGNYSLVYGDWSSCELGIIANNSSDPLWLDAINNGKDLHGILTAKTFNIDESRIKDKTPFNTDISYRDVQKSIDFGLAYGMSKFKLSIVMKTTVEYAEVIINKFFKVVPKVKKYLTSIGIFAKRNFFAVTNEPYFRIRRFDLDSKAGDRERAGKNHPIQGTNADMVKLAMVRILLERPDHRIKLILPMHDEILTRCPDELTIEWKIQLTEIMESVAKLIAPKVSIKADVKINKQWIK